MIADPKPNAEELKALRLFVGQDETRPSLFTLWEYVSEGGCTHLASDGHTLAMRRAGTHVPLSILEIEKLPAVALDNQASPYKWSSVFKRPNLTGPNCEKRAINPAYFARVARVERAAGRRAASDYVPSPGTSKKSAALKRLNIAGQAFSIWSIPIDSLDAWCWVVSGDVVWEGLIMPRRL